MGCCEGGANVARGKRRGGHTLVVTVMDFCLKSAPSTLMLMQRLGALDASLTRKRPAFYR